MTESEKCIYLITVLNNVKYIIEPEQLSFFLKATNYKHINIVPAPELVEGIYTRWKS